MTRETCECRIHGTNVATFVCNHITTALCEGTTAEFVCYPGEDDDGLSDAWCDACQHFLQANGGKWIDDEVEVPGGLSILCAECYREARLLAADAGCLRIM